VSGLITRRLSWTTAAAWATSTLDRAGNNGHRGRSVTSQATYALNSTFALFARYIYYKYRYDEGIPLDSRLPRALDRQGVRVGLTTIVPLIR
jgi:predicted porin